MNINDNARRQTPSSGPKLSNEPRAVRARIEALERVMENLFRLPGTNRGVGLDVVLDFLPVVGPTAAGKTALGISLAQALNGEVVNADSMQLYRGMDIGTAKVTVNEADGVPHHVLDIWDVTEPASVVLL